MVATTRPYYRSTYVVVTRADRDLKGLTLDDPRLKKLTVGVQMVGDDAMNTPPAHALAARGMTANVRGFMLYGDYAKPNPPAEIIRAVADGKVDISLVWGPLAGYFAKSSPVPLRIERVTPWLDNAQWPMVYDISMGVRKYDPAFQQQVETILARRKSEISALLDRYGVPRVD
jgi:mxaJ protein